MQGHHPCDKRRTVSEYRHMFPAIDFSLASDLFILNLGYGLAATIKFDLVHWLLEDN